MGRTTKALLLHKFYNLPSKRKKKKKKKGINTSPTSKKTLVSPTKANLPFFSTK